MKGREETVINEEFLTVTGKSAVGNPSMGQWRRWRAM